MKSTLYSGLSLVLHYWWGEKRKNIFFQKSVLLNLVRFLNQGIKPQPNRNESNLWLHKYFKIRLWISYEGAAILLASCTSILSTVCAFIMIFLDKRRTRSIRAETVNQSKVVQKIKFTDALKFPFEFWLLVIIVAVFYCATFPFVVRY